MWIMNKYKCNNIYRNDRGMCLRLHVIGVDNYSKYNNNDADQLSSDK